MSRKRRHKAKRKAPTAKVVAAEASKANPYRDKEVWRDILKGILFVVIVIAIKLSIEQTVFGKQMKLMGYNYLQTQLSSEPPPVTIVDISDLPSQDFIDGETVNATPREPLKKMIEAIAEQQPKAIGVDIDFSPEDGYVHPSDPEFFQSCLELQKQTGVPVFLGVNRTIAKPADEWLGSKKFEKLAANILVPNDSQRMLNVLQVGHSKEDVGPGEESKPSRSMSALLAKAYGRSDNSSLGQRVNDSLISFRLVQKFREEWIGSDLLFKDFLVDYGPLESIETETIQTTDPTVLRDTSNRKRLKGRIVLIGDATLGKATDTFVIPARDKPYPGIFAHACAAYTLIKAPLYKLTEAGHILLDFLLSGIVLLGVVLVKYRYKDDEKRDVTAEKWRGRLTLLIVLTAIVVGVIFVRITRIMWDDFFLALILLVFHPSIEHHAETLWTKIKRRLFHSGDRPTGENERKTSMTIHGLLLIMSLIVILSFGSGVMAQSLAVGFIEDISGVVILKRSGKQIRLDSRTDRGRRLLPGDSFRPTRGAKLSVRIGKESKYLDDNSSWFVIPNRVYPRSDPFRIAIDEYGRIGGRDRGVIRESMLFSPADDTVVTPESFIIRWAPAKKNCVATMEIQKPGAEVLWQEKNVNSASGELNSKSARQVLESYRSATEVGTLRLKLKDSCGNGDHSDFTLLSVADENSLKKELEVWDKDRQSLMSHLGRAAVFSQYRMFSHVAEEYEQALALAPMSRDLLLRTVEAQRLIGNLIRAKELKRQVGRK